MQSKKTLYLELMRILAAFFVIFNHTRTTGFFLFSLYEPNSFQYWICLIFSIFCKFSVPLFFMISGALLLDRQSESFKRLYTHRVGHMCFILIAWSFFYYLTEIRAGNETFSLVRFFSRLYDSNWNVSYWYLYAFIPFLMSLPLLQRIAQNLSNREYLYLLALYVAFNMILPSVQYLLWHGDHNLNTSLRLAWISSNIFIYPLIGYFLQHRAKDYWNMKKILLLWSANILTILLSCYLTYLRAKITGICDEDNSQTFHNTFILINCITIFVTLQYWGNHSKILEKLQKPIISIGSCTFGIYLLHIYIKDFTSLTPRLWHIFQEQIHMPAIIYAFFYCAAIFVCCYLITLVIKHIPIIRKLVS